MLGFWPSDAGLLLTQAALVCGPRPGLPAPLAAAERLRGGGWAWIMPVSLGGTIALIAADPGLAQAYAWIAALGIPLLAVPALAALLDRTHASTGVTMRTWAVSGVCSAGLLVFAWTAHTGLSAQATAVALTALSTATLASYLATVTPVPWLKAGVLTLAALDAVLVSARLLQGPNDALNAASPGAGLPHLQVAVFGSALVGYGDLFIAAVLGTIIVRDPGLAGVVRPWQGALVVLGCAAAFDTLFLAVDVLPATVPVAVALLLMEGWKRRADRTSAPSQRAIRRDTEVRDTET